MLMNASRAHRVVLADEPPFRLGSAWVEPAFRQISWDDGQAILEPKVMQVLTVLCQADGSIVSREALVERCWDGRFVGDNAVNRVLSRVRALGAETRAFDLQTITKVGYRLVVSSEAAPADRVASAPASAPSSVTDRRRLLALCAGIVLTGGGAFVWRGLARDAPPEEAVRLTQHALDGFRISQNGPDPRVLAELQEAVRIAPNYAEAWGGLAAVYAELSASAPLSNRAGLEVRAKGAAARALSIDPREPRALIARLQLRHRYRDWAAFERECRRLLPVTRRHPLILGALGNVLQEVGRWSDSAPFFEEVNRALVTNPIGHYKLVLALWSSGNTEAAEQALEKAVRRFPQHPAVWQTKVKMLMFTGKPDEAVAAATDRSGRPPSVRDEALVPLIAAARAMSSGSAAEARRAIQINLERLSDTRDTFPVIYRCSALGDRDTAFAILEGYYFGRGRWGGLSPPIDGSEGERWTSSLFQPAAINLWRDARFAKLLTAIGLSDYWIRVGVSPDYLRLA